MSQESRVYNFYNKQTNLGPPYFKEYLSGELLRKPTTLYYKVYTDSTNTTPNCTATTFVTDPIDGPYRGIQNRFMMNVDGTENANLLTFIGYRTPGDISLGIPGLYNETVSINVQPYSDNFIQSTANYNDGSGGFVTALEFLDYKVSIASGIFSGRTNMRIYFDNVNFTRRVVIT